MTRDGGRTVELVDYDYRRCTDEEDGDDVVHFVKVRSTLETVMYMAQIAASILQAAFLYVVPLVVIITFNTRLGRFLAANQRAMEAHSRPMLETRAVHSDDGEPANAVRPCRVHC